MNKNLVRIGVAVLTTVLALVILWQFRVVLIYVLISLMLAASMRPLFTRLAGHSVIRRVLWIFIYIVAVCGFGFLLFLVLRASGTELQLLAQSLSVRNEWSLPLWLGSSFQQALLARLPSPSVFFQAVIGNDGQLVVPALLGIVQSVGSVVTAFAIILILSIYWSINQIHFERLWLSLLPSDKRKRARGIWRTFEPDIGGYIRAQFIQSLLTGVVLGLGYWLAGSPYPMLLALVGALACLIPVVGPILAVLSPLLIGLLTSVSLSLITGSFTLVIFIAIFIWIKPRLFNRRWDNPILTVILLIALAEAFGIVGIIVAPPVSAICQIVWSRLVSHRVEAGAATRLSDLKGRLAHLRETINAMEEPQIPLVTSSIERLDALMVTAEPILHASGLVETSEVSDDQKKRRESC
jgi:predicted PurR-regulated permease PerM